mgnify:CR=1 FL=1
MKISLPSLRTGVTIVAMAGLAVMLVFTLRECTALKKQITDMTAAAQRAEIEAQAQQREIEHEWQQKADAAAAAAQAELVEVQASYEDSLQSLYGLLADYADGDGLHADGAGGDPTALPAAPAAPGAACKPCPDGRSSTDTAKLQRLLEQQMTVARDCDITASRYNELLKLWQGVQE